MLPVWLILAVPPRVVGSAPLEGSGHNFPGMRADWKGSSVRGFTRLLTDQPRTLSSALLS